MTNHSHMFDAKHAAAAYDRLQLENDLAETMAKEISQQVDFEILTDLLIQLDNWTKVELGNFKDSKHQVDVQNWIDKNCKTGTCRSLGSTFVFKHRKDAEWFILRWL
jgi:hypothetical protein